MCIRDSIYDYHPELNVIFTGSSVLDINKGASDLSRRAVMYQMQGLSFRAVSYTHLKDMAENNTLVQTGNNAGWSQKLVVTNNVFDVNTKIGRAHV